MQVRGIDGCAGRVVSVPMSGSPTADDPDNVVVWWFRVPAGTSCAVAVFVRSTLLFVYAAAFPEQTLYLFAVIPIRVRWLAFVAGGMFVYGAATGATANVPILGGAIPLRDPLAKSFLGLLSHPLGRLLGGGNDRRDALGSRSARGLRAIRVGLRILSHFRRILSHARMVETASA